jgi:hypothetical protein
MRKNEEKLKQTYGVAMRKREMRANSRDVI